MTSTLALIGGDEFSDGCSFDADLLEASGGSEVLVITAAAAYQDPAVVIDRAIEWFSQLGANVVASPLRLRADALVETSAEQIRSARFIYLTDGVPMHLRSVLKDSPCYTALVEAFVGGAVVAGAGAGGDVLCDPMVDPRGGAYTVGLGLVPGLSIIPRFETWSDEKVERTVHIAPAGTTVVGLPLRTAIIRQDEGEWNESGVGTVRVWREGMECSVDVLHH